MKITIEDKYSKSADPRRGYHDYEYTVTFEPDSKGSWLTDESMDKYMKMLHAHVGQGLVGSMGNGWCHGYEKTFHDPVEKKTIYRFTHGYDSGD